MPALLRALTFPAAGAASGSGRVHVDRLNQVALSAAGRLFEYLRRKQSVPECLVHDSSVDHHAWPAGLEQVERLSVQLDVGRVVGLAHPHAVPAACRRNVWDNDVNLG